MLLPYNVDRPTRRVPYYTYVLMGLNIFVYLASIVVSNVNLPADQVQAKQEIKKLTADPNAPAEPEPTPAGDDESGGSSKAKDLANRIAQIEALQKASEKAQDADGYKRFWQIQHAYDGIVFDPHYTTLEHFAFRPSNPSFLGLVCSMFIHFGILHLLGNMLYLWVFGRALEDALGPRVFVGAYLVCGLAAGLLHHIMTVQFTPLSKGVPAAGASGAIAGVLGLFMLRFYRTPVRVFYLTIFLFLPFAIGFLIVWIIVTLIWLFVLHIVWLSAVLALITMVAALGYFGRGWAWGMFRSPAAWSIGIYVAVFDLYPAIKGLVSQGEQGGVAHWAHIGGFLFGMIYALLIGSQTEGKAEFMLEDAQKAQEGGDADRAIAFATNLLEREPDNPGAYEVMAKAFDKRNDEENALDNYELAIQKFLAAGEREAAARAYQTALVKHPRFIMDAATQLALGTQYFRGGDYLSAAETFVKIPYTFPDAPEGEVALLRSAQLYVHQLQQPQMALQLLQLFLQRYPESEWMPQAQRSLKVATYQLNQPAEEEMVGEPEAEQAPAQPARVRPQAVLTSEISPPPQ